jgi:hypothetical protein
MLRYSVSRRPLILIFVGLSILALMTVGVAFQTALADEGVPIRGNFTVSIAFIPTANACGIGDSCVACVSSYPPRFYIEAQGIGDTSKLGTMFLKIQKCADPAASPFGSYSGTFTLTAPNGKDSLTGIYTGKNTSAPDAYGFGPFSGEWEITGGTGSFDNARGRVHFSALFSGNGTAYYAVEGTMSSRGEQL